MSGQSSRARWLISLGILAFGGLLSLTATAEADAYAAKAALTPRLYYINDTAGSVYTFTVYNTGTSTNIGAIEIKRPSLLWKVMSCPTGPAGWLKTAAHNKCRYRSTSSSSDDIKPGQSRTFSVKASTVPGTMDHFGRWGIVVSNSNHFNAPSLLKYAAPSGTGLTATLHTFQLTRAVVSATSKTPGSACPATNKTAIAASSKTIVVCGKNRASIPLTPNSANSSLGGTFIGTPGTFLSGAIPAKSGEVVLADWNSTLITNVPGTGKKVLASIGSRSDRTSSLRTFMHYSATNTLPVANNDAFNVNEDVTLNPLAAGGVLANDTDAEGNALTATKLTDPAHGTLTLNADGSFEYVPEANYAGPDSFTYVANDGFGNSAAATANITVNAVNDPPVAAADPDTTDENTAKTVTVLGNDTDVDGDALVVSAVDTTGTTGTVTNNGTDVSYDPNGQFESLRPSQTATDTFTYTVSDGNGGTDTETVTMTITGVNDAPDAVNDTDSTDEATGTGPISVLTNDSDDEGAVTITSVDTTGTSGLVTNNNDGTISYSPNGAFEYLENGEDDTDTFTYTVTDLDGGTDTATVTVTVTGINDAPVAVDDAPSVGENSTGSTVNVLGNDTDAESQTLTVTAVDTTGTTGTVTNNGTDVTYDPNGQFETLGNGETATDTFTYTVTDSQGGTDTATVTVTITGVNDPPVAVDDAYSTDEATQIGPLTVLVNDSDTEGAVTITGVDTTGTLGQVTNNNDGTLTYNPNGAFEHLENGEDQDDTFTYTITDAQGATDTATVTVDVNGINDAPVAAPDAANVPESSTGTTVNVLGNDTDAESQTLTVTGINTVGTTGTVTNNGTDVTYDPDGLFEYLTTGQTETTTFTYTVTDSQGATDTETVTITIQGANDLPVAVDDNESTNEASTVLVSVVFNDTDAEGAVTVTGVDTTGTLGTVTNNNDGTVTYDPNGAFEHLENGEPQDDTFTYTITDGNGGTDTATVTVTVNGINDAPVAAADGPSVSEDSTGTVVNVLGNDTDAESQTLTVSGVNTTGTTGTVTNNGTDVTYDPDGQFESLGTGQTATTTFTYTVEDTQGATDTETVTVTITGVNDLPVAVDDSVSTGENASIGPIAVLTNDSDDEGALTITGISTAGTLGQVTNNNDGTLAYDPNGAFEHLENGEPQDDTFTYTVTDSNGATDTATVTVTVNGVNDAPVAAPDAAGFGENSSGGAVNVLGNDTDAESQTLTVTGVDTTGTSGMVTNNGTDVTYDPNGMFEYLDDTETATDTFTYTVSDTQGGNDTETVTVTITGANDAPVANDDAYQVVQDTNLTVTAPGVLTNDTDADSEALTAGNASDPANGTVTLNADGSFSYDPDSGHLGADSFTYDVTDGTATDTATVNITVVPPNDTPTADATSASGDEDGSGIVVTLTGHDADGDALTFSAGTATNGLVSVPGSVSCDSNVPSLCSATVTYTPNANFFGSDSFTYTVDDGTISSAPATASITVDPVNDQPSFTKGADQTVLEDSVAQTVNGWATAISAGPANESAQVVTFAASTNNDGLFAVFPAISSTGILTYTPAVNANGVATVTVQATDDGGTANGGNNQSPTQTFDITVTAVNDVPSFTKGADQTLFEDAGAQSVSGWATAISKGPADESAQGLSFTTSNDNNALFSVQPDVSPTGTLTYTSAANAVGTATVTIYLSDTGGTANGGDDTSDSQTFTVTVNGVNDQPSFTDDGDQTVLEDAGAQTVNGFVNTTSSGPADESAQNVTVTVTGTTNDALFSSLPAIDSAGTLTYTPAVNANGSATVTAVATDDGGTANGGDNTGANETFVITVTPVNDVPSFTKGADQTLNEDAGAQSVSGWATAISEGPANEVAQDVSFNVSNDNNALFSSQPAISPTGTLTYTSTANKYGTATVTVSISDNGGIANGGVDTSATQTFLVTVNAVNDAPVAAAKAFTVQANMKISLSGLLTGATDPNDVNGGSTAQPPVTHTPSFTLGTITPGANCVGCTISNVNNANGTFDFDPPAGGTGSFSITYTVVDNGFPTPGATSAAETITFTVNGPVVWFVDEDAVTVGTGRLSEPFQNLSSATTAMGANTNQRIHVEDGNSTGNVVLQTNSWLISDTITGSNFDTVMGITPPAGTIARPSNPGAPQRTLTGSVTLGDNSVARGFDLTPGSGTPGLVGSGADGVTVNTMSITTTNARGVDVQNSQGSTFSITRVTSTGATSGIFLSTVNTTTPGSFTVTGTGSADSGGIISTSSGNGIHLDNVTDVNLSRMRVTGGSAHGIYGNNLTTFDIDNSTIVNNGTNIALDHSGIYMTNLLGTSTMATLDVSGSREHNIFVRNSSGTSTLTLSNSTIHDNNATEGSNGVAVISQLGGTATMTFTSTTNTFTNNRSSALLIFGESNQKMTATVTGGTWSGNGVGMDIASNGPGGLGFTVSNGTITSGATSGAGIVVTKGSSSSGTGTNALAGTITGMNITHNNSGIASGIWLHGEGGGQARLAVTNNTVTNSGLYGIEASFGNTLGGSQDVQLNITGNTASTVNAPSACPSGCAVAAILAEAGTVTGDTTAMCAHISGNTASNPDGADIRVRTIQSTSFRLPSYAGGNSDTAAVQSFVQTNNGGATAAAFKSSTTGFTGGAPSTCTAP